MVHHEQSTEPAQQPKWRIPIVDYQVPAWTFVAVLLAVSLSILAYSVPLNGSYHVSNLLDFVSHYKAGVISLIITIITAFYMSLASFFHILASNPVVIMNMLPISVGAFGVYLTIFSAFHSDPQTVYNDVNFNRGVLLFSVMASYFLGGTIHRNRDSDR